VLEKPNLEAARTRMRDRGEREGRSNAAKVSKKGNVTKSKTLAMDEFHQEAGAGGRFDKT